MVRGRIKSILNDKEIKVLEYTDCMTFGEFSFITNLERQETIQAYDFCKIYRISREKFINQMK